MTVCIWAHLNVTFLKIHCRCVAVVGAHLGALEMHAYTDHGREWAGLLKWMDAEIANDKDDCAEKVRMIRITRTCFVVWHYSTTTVYYHYHRQWLRWVEDTIAIHCSNAAIIHWQGRDINAFTYCLMMVMIMIIMTIMIMMIIIEDGREWPVKWIDGEIAACLLWHLHTRTILLIVILMLVMMTLRRPLIISSHVRYCRVNSSISDMWRWCKIISDFCTTGRRVMINKSPLCARCNCKTFTISTICLSWQFAVRVTSQTVETPLNVAVLWNVFRIRRILIYFHMSVCHKRDIKHFLRFIMMMDWLWCTYV